MPVNPDEVSSYFDQVKQEVAARGEEGGEGAGAAQEGAETAAVEGAEGAGVQSQEQAAGTEQQQQAQPNPVEAATNGKFKSLEDMDAFIAGLEEKANKPSVSADQQQLLDMVTRYGEKAPELIAMSKMDVSKMPLKQLIATDFARRNPELSRDAVEDGAMIELKTALGDPKLFIDLEDDETHGLGAFHKEKLDTLIGGKRTELGGFFQNLIPELLKNPQSEKGGDALLTSPISDEVKKAIALEVDGFTSYRPDWTEALGEDGKELELAVSEIPGFSEVAEMIKADPQKYLESVFMTPGRDGKPPQLNVKELLAHAASKAGSPLLLHKHSEKIGESRYTDGLAEGTGKTAEEVRNALGLNKGRTDADTRTPDQIKQDETRQKVDAFYAKAKNQQ